ncbi:DUF4145 domain-containing protein [Paraferrimonas sedimenticola]|uniref:DUF4145 domain-containing protein n=1 Tax=Paraferrimonas sedimenticola TaxID=375674 RepID=A0AA37RZE8_9GAMM|nr:DUF4145 domain-containing protein [Paraferrimonas sedimenticola]GLP97829.1 hypothetical protein GCM10007895_31360 [Paraferrimonas sedimenticola]
MGKGLTDEQLVAELLPELGDDYRVAKSYARDVPTQSLLMLRSLLHQLTAKIAEQLGSPLTTVNLYDRIEDLNRQRLINVRLTRRMHKIRADGNRGAHPEKYRLDFSQLITIAERSVTRCAELAAELYPVLLKRDAPEYRFVPFDSIAGREICYRAVMENDPQAQVLVGQSLKSKALELRNQEFAAAEKAQQTVVEHHGSAALFAQAAHYFELAHERLDDGAYEYGVALVNGFQGKAQIERGSELVAKAAKAEHADAMALYGFWCLTGTKAVAVDLEQAEHYLTLAADKQQPEAMANLGVLHYQGGPKGVDKTQAFEFTHKAAQAGYPQAQYNLQLMLLNGDGCKADPAAAERWLAEAAEQGHLDAMLVRAQHMLSSDELGQDHQLARQYLQEVIRYGHSLTAMVELALALANGAFGEADWPQAVAWLKAAEHRAEQVPEDEMARALPTLKQEFMRHIQSELEASSDDTGLNGALAQLTSG